MKVKHTIKFDKTTEIAAAAKALDGSRVEVGVGGEHAWLAGIHEYGCRIPVTDKMRAFFRAKFGISLKKTTTHIVIPERSFLRSGFDAYHLGVLDTADRMLAEVLSGNLPVADLYEAVGGELRGKIKLYAQNLSSPPNAPLTIKNKGSSNPLVDLGDMIRGIEFHVKKG